MDIFERLGAKGVKFNFEIEFHYIEIELPQETHIKVEWKSHTKSIKTSSEIVVDNDKTKVDIEETLSNTHTIYTKKHSIPDKKIELKVLGEINGKIKDIGKVVLNLVEYLDAPVIEQVHRIEKCKDKNAKICISVKAESLGAATLSSTMMGSTIGNEAVEDPQQLEEPQQEVLLSEETQHVLTELKTQCEKSEKTLEDLSHENHELKEKNSKKDQDANYSEESENKLNEKIKKAKAKNKSRKQDIEKIENNVEELNEVLERLKYEKEGIIKELAMKELDKKEDHLKDKIDELKEIRERIEEEESNQKKDENELNKNIQLLSKKNDFLESEIERLRVKLEPAQKEEERDEIEEMLFDNMKNLRNITTRYTVTEKPRKDLV
ncbi:unnamed protein product [Blepharisma stoltei]|uniref:C2 NT-type domain-containing protein n=1 Tax=Blepharisma stoltei TaxID=1481888 RepID=A0AAU9JTU1_9CILI|nr:unnamed protein product [Blepharisma stoltei]